jgi:hypothetical protein
VLDAGEFEFGIHALQLVAPTIDEYVSTGQFVQFVFPVLFLYCPDTQDWHVSHPVTSTSTSEILPVRKGAPGCMARYWPLSGVEHVEDIHTSLVFAKD